MLNLQPRSIETHGFYISWYGSNKSSWPPGLSWQQRIAGRYYHRQREIRVQGMFLEPTLPDRWSRCTFRRHGQAARLLSTIQNGGAQYWILALFGEEFQWDQMHFELKPRSVTQLSVIFLFAISKNTPFLEWPFKRVRFKPEKKIFGHGFESRWSPENLFFFWAGWGREA